MADRVYDAAQVDEYVVRMHEHITTLNEEIARLRAVPPEARPPSEDVERVLGRALLHVQRMADAAEHEADVRHQALLDEATATLDAARAEHDARVAEAQRCVDEMIADGERRAEQLVADAAARVRASTEAAKARVDAQAAEWRPSRPPATATAGNHRSQLAAFAWADVAEPPAPVEVVIDLTDDLRHAPPPSGTPVIALDDDGIELRPVVR